MERKSMCHVGKLALVLFFFTGQPLFSAYGMIKLITHFRIVNYPAYGDLLNIARRQESSQQTKIIGTQIKPEKRHLTLTYAQLPLDDALVDLFPDIKDSGETLPVEERKQFYQNTIPSSLETHLAPHLNETISHSDSWEDPITLKFSKLQKLGVFLTATFNLDDEKRLQHISYKVESTIKDHLPHATRTFDLIPHLSLSRIKSSFGPKDLMQPEEPITPLIIDRESRDYFTISARVAS